MCGYYENESAVVSFKPFNDTRSKQNLALLAGPCEITFLLLPTAPMEAEKLKIKQALLSEALRMQRATIENVRKAMMEAQESANDNEDDTEEKLFSGYREEMQNKRDMFARQLDQAIDDQALLQKVNVQEEHPVAEFGSVIVTEAQKLFVSISLGQIKVGNDAYFAISPSAPIYKALVGKKIGETFEFREKKTKVLDVF